MLEFQTRKKEIEKKQLAFSYLFVKHITKEIVPSKLSFFSEQTVYVVSGGHIVDTVYTIEGGSSSRFEGGGIDDAHLYGEIRLEDAICLNILAGKRLTSLFRKRWWSGRMTSA